MTFWTNVKRIHALSCVILGCQYKFEGQEEFDATALCLLEGPAGGSGVPYQSRSRDVRMRRITDDRFALGRSV